jgi:hypothetical protein
LEGFTLKLMICCCIFSLACVSGANLIVNGDFETLAIGAGTFRILGSGDTTDLPGWTVTGTTCGANCVATLSTTYSEGPLVFEAESGSQSVDLTGAGNTLNGGIQQTITTTAGARYTISFFVGNMDNASPNYPSASSVLLNINGVGQGTFTNNTSTANRLNWQQFNVNFTAPTNSTVIQFVNGTPATDNEAGLDNVSVDTVPEPATFGFISIAGVAALIFRRTRAPKRG